jgi:hypothetical protein
VTGLGAAGRPEWREIDDEALRRRTRVYVDSREAALSEYGDTIAAEWGLMELGKSSPERNLPANRRKRLRYSNRVGWRWKTW